MKDISEGIFEDNSRMHNRRSIRLKNYDYAQEGMYFVTICAQNREYVFGSINDGKLILNEVGCMVSKIWNELSVKYQCIEIDEFIVMPNHIHGIIILSVGAGASACPEKKGQPQGVAPTGLSLPDVVHRFKSFTTTQYRVGVNQSHRQSFSGRLWQRNYYEHIIRNDDSLGRIRDYIINNPLKWEDDIENPANRENNSTKNYYEKIF